MPTTAGFSRTWPDSAGAPLREGDRVRYHGTLTGQHGTWTFDGPCPCNSCVAWYFDLCEQYPGQTHAAGRAPVPNTHVLRRDDGRAIEHVSESHITALSGDTAPGRPAPLTSDLLARAPLHCERVWLLGVDADEDTIDAYGEYPVDVRNETEPVARIRLGAGPWDEDHYDPRMCGDRIELWAMGASPGCFIAAFDSEAAMQEGASALAAARDSRAWPFRSPDGTAARARAGTQPTAGRRGPARPGPCVQLSLFGGSPDGPVTGRDRPGGSSRRPAGKNRRSPARGVPPPRNAGGP